VEKTAPDEVIAGVEFPVEIKLTNLTGVNLQDVVLTETPSSKFQVAKTSPSATKGGTSLIWRIGNLDARASKSVAFHGAINEEGVWDGCTSITYTSVAGCRSVKVVRPALEITKTITPEILVCDPATVTLKVTNPGSGAANNVVITDRLPNGLQASDGKSTASFEIGALAPGESKEVSFQVEAESAGEYSNQATATADRGLRAESSVVSVRARKPVIEITKQGPKRRYLGRSAKFVLEVKNNGDGPARDLVVTDEFSSGFTIKEASDGGQIDGNSIRWSLGTLAAGQSKSLRVVATASQIAESVVNRANAKAYCAEDSTEFLSRIEGIPAILLECIDLEDPIEVGAHETYRIVVTNQGSAVGTNIVIKCTIPAEMSFVKAGGPTGHAAKGKTVTFEPLKSLAAKAKAEYRVFLKGEKIGDARFGVSLTSDQMQTPAEETESTHVYE
jgi:uncharacterized repeat protein (TIGR01451 family)